MSNSGNSSHKETESSEKDKQWNWKDRWDNIYDKWLNSLAKSECIQFSYKKR